MERPHLAQDQAFLAYLDQWLAALPERSAGEIFAEPQRAAILSVDLIQGFCTIGPLASPRVDSIVQPAVDLMQRAWDSGVRHLVLSQDTHEPDAVEFGAWPPHCVRDTPESQTVEAITALPFYSQAVTIRKNSIATGLDSEMEDWLLTHPEVDTFVVVGDCTDLCVYQMAMHLRLDANARQIERRVIVPENAVQTYDLPVEAAQAGGIFPHPGDFLHKVFLYHMALNGIEVIRSIGA
jgi:nicotinamidase-related amidase